VRQSGPPLPQPIDVLLGWVVREGVTNVVRHSGARRCWIEIEHRPATVRLELRDDGVGAPPPVTDALAPDAGANSGHGLTGLRERVHAAGGELESGALRGRRGFGLVVCLPVETTTPDDRTGVPA
jgi:two-component system sensor histidine kinase DesK